MNARKVAAGVQHREQRTYYIRVGTQSREANRDKLERLFQQRGGFHLELRPVSGSSISDLDIRRLQDYFSRVRNQDIPEENDEEGWKTLLTNTEFLHQGGDSNPCTVAAILLFGRNPHRFLPQSAVDCAAYAGKEKDYAAVERVTARGPLLGLFTPKGERIELLEAGGVEQAVSFVKRNMGTTAALLSGAVRRDRPTYPEEVIREGVVNAVVHRDYPLSSTDVELSIYSDRIEIISPGRLPNGITTDRMRVGCRSARNQLVKD